jgi:hypothetical protein
MKAVLLSVGLSAVSAAASQAAVFFTPPFPLDKTSELVVNVVNTCATSATYDIVIKNAITGQNLRHRQGTLAVNRGTILPYSLGASNPLMVYQKITVECRDNAKAKPMIGFAVRDLQTKMPRFTGGTDEGTGI